MKEVHFLVIAEITLIMHFYQKWLMTSVYVNFKINFKKLTVYALTTTHLLAGVGDDYLVAQGGIDGPRGRCWVRRASVRPTTPQDHTAPEEAQGPKNLQLQDPTHHLRFLPLYSYKQTKKFVFFFPNSST